MCKYTTPSAAAYEELRHVREVIAAAQATEEELKQLFINGTTAADEVSENKAVYRYGDGHVTVSLCAGRETIDAKGLKGAFPEIYEKFKKTGNPSYRVVTK